MARNYAKAKPLAKPRKRPDLMAVMRQGYLDAKQGAPFARFYETLPRWSQNNYEFGRLIALYLGGANAPNWQGNVILPRFIEPTLEKVKRDFMPYEAKQEGA